MSYREKIQAVISTISASRSRNFLVEEFLITHDKFMSYLLRQDWVDAVDVTPIGLAFVPRDAKATAKHLADHFDITFTREFDIYSGFYQWVSLIPDINLPITILANESQPDLEGTTVTL